MNLEKQLNTSVNACVCFFCEGNCREKRHLVANKAVLADNTSITHFSVAGYEPKYFNTINNNVSIDKVFCNGRPTDS